MSNKLETYRVKDWVVFGRNTFPPPFKLSDNLINEARIVHVVQGRARFYSANQFVDLASGDTLVMKADNFVNNWKENADGQLSQVIVFQLTADFLRFLYETHIPSFLAQNPTVEAPAVVKARSSPLLATFFNSLNSYLDHPQLITEEMTQLKVRELIMLLVQTNKASPMRQIFGNLFHAQSYDFQQVIQQNLFEDLSIEDLAFLTNLSLSSFKRRFSSVYGTSPNKYIISKRLEKAQTLLSTTDLRISDIAYACGFNDLGYFSKTFRQHYNLSPSDFRKHTLD